MSQIEHMARSHTLQLHRPPTIVHGNGYIHLSWNLRSTYLEAIVLIFSRKITLIGPIVNVDIEGALRSRFPDLVQDNFGIGQVHLSYYLTEPVTDPGWSVQLMIPYSGR